MVKERRGMVGHRLRIYHDPHEREVLDKRVRLEQVVALLADAHQNNRTWLRDFKDQRIQISADFYEVLQAYQKSQSISS